LGQLATGLERNFKFINKFSKESPFGIFSRSGESCSKHFFELNDQKSAIIFPEK
jgi:hypothetical protein